MGVKEYINSRPGVVLGILACCLILAGMLAASKMRRAGPSLPIMYDRAFYTTDDGATLFADSVYLRPPFDHDARQAVGACVFKNGASKWVGYLMKWSDAGKKQWDLVQSSEPGAVAAPLPSELLVKRPGDENWVASTTPEGKRIMEPKDLVGTTGIPAPVHP